MNAAVKSLVILTPGFPENEGDSTCLPWLQNFVRTLHRQYPLVKIIVLSFQYPYKKQPYIWEGADVIPFAGKNKGGFAKLKLHYLINRQLKKLYREKPFDVMLSIWYGECAWLAGKFSREKNLNHYCWIAGQDAKKDNPYPAKLGIKGNRLIAVSDFVQELFTECHGVKPAHVIPFGTDASLFMKNRPEKDIDILAAGSFIPLKQYELFVEVIKAVKEERRFIKAVLIGKGPEERKIYELIVKYRLQDNITLTGELPYNVVLQYMQRAKIFLHPSAYEGFGCVCTEALYAGAYVIRLTQPMKKEMQNSFIVADKEEMISKTIGLLRQNKIAEPVNEYPVEETAERTAALLGL